MKLFRMTMASAALAGLAGCATSLDMGPGYYHYDWRLAGTPAVVATTTAPVAYTAPVVTYTEPVAYKEPVVVVREPTIMRYWSTTVR
jgi:hypothetical protein